MSEGCGGSFANGRLGRSVGVGGGGWTDGRCAYMRLTKAMDLLSCNLSGNVSTAGCLSPPVSSSLVPSPRIVSDYHGRRAVGGARRRPPNIAIKFIRYHNRAWEVETATDSVHAAPQLPESRERCVSRRPSRSLTRCGPRCLWTQQGENWPCFLSG
eukprot:scaffold9868_cov125-Isochrysis_galbana.AAC.3